ncbi:MAG TPA: hypothetical protein VIH99_13170 [Bdellovibrionota bacterium]|jgi:hypothetical protein
MHLLWLWIALSLGLPAFGSEEVWYVVRKNGKTSAVFSESVTKDVAEKSVSIRQKWELIAPARGRIKLESLSVGDATLSPSWMKVRFKKKDGKKEFRFTASAVSDLGKPQFKLEFEQIKPKKKKTEKFFDNPPDGVFYTALPLYLSRLKTGTYLATGIMEDIDSPEFSTKKLRLQRLDESKDIHGERCSRSVVDIGGFPGDLWANAAGRLCELSLPTMKTKISRSTDAEAKKLLKR